MKPCVLLATSSVLLRNVSNTAAKDAFYYVYYVSNASARNTFTQVSTQYKLYAQTYFRCYVKVIVEDETLQTLPASVISNIQSSVKKCIQHRCQQCFYKQGFHSLNITKLCINLFFMFKRRSQIRLFSYLAFVVSNIQCC